MIYDSQSMRFAVTKLLYVYTYFRKYFRTFESTFVLSKVLSYFRKIETVLPYRNALYVVRVRVSDTFVRKYFRTFVQVKLSEIKLRRYESTVPS
jgi:hypothetical protein